MLVRVQKLMIGQMMAIHYSFNLQSVMKNCLFSIEALAIVAITLFSCTKVSELEESNVNDNDIEIVDTNEGTPFELIAGTLDTKTTNDGMSTKWESTDKINVFFAEAGQTSYTNAGQFTSTGTGTSVSFTGTVGELNDNNDWFAFYPYKASITTPNNTSTYSITVGGAQTWGSSATATAHLCGEKFPVCGRAMNVAKATKPTIEMYPAMSAVKVHVTNNSGAALTVNSVNFSTEDYPINGSFYIAFNGATPVFTEKSGSTGKSSTLTVQGGRTIATLGTEDFYIGVVPFTAASGKKITVTVNGFSKQLTLSSEAVFAPGKIKTLNFNYNETITPATLPFSLTGEESSSDIADLDGVTYYNVIPQGYAAGNAPYRIQCKTDGGYLQVFFNQAASKVSFDVKMIGGANTTHFDVKGSADGVTYSQIERFTVSGSQGDVLNFETTEEISSTYRYIRIIYDRGASGSNVGLGPVTISKVSTDPEIQASNITGVAVAGVTTTMTYTLKNFGAVEDIVPTCDGTVVTSVSKPSNGTISYTVAPNYGTASRSTGTITLTSASKSVNKVISVTQNGETFATTATATITLGKDATSTTFTITTASFAWASTVTAEEGKDLTLDPSSGSANASAQTITINSTTAATASEQTLGTIVLYRNGNTSDTQKITVTVKKAATSGSSYTKVASSPASWAGTYLICYGEEKVATDVAIPSGSKYYLLTTDVSVSSNIITGNATIDTYAVTIEALTGDDTGYYSIRFGTNKYLSNSGSNANFAAPPTSVTSDNQKWSLAYSDGTVTITNKGSSRIIKWYSTDNQFRCYASGNTSPNPTLYKKN